MGVISNITVITELKRVNISYNNELSMGCNISWYKVGLYLYLCILFLQIIDIRDIIRAATIEEMKDVYPSLLLLISPTLIQKALLSSTVGLIPM